MRKPKRKGNGNGTKIGVLVWRPKAETRRQSKEFTREDTVHDILSFAKNIQKTGASEMRLTLHLNQLCPSGKRISLEDKMVTGLSGALRSHGIEESTIHFI